MIETVIFDCDGVLVDSEILAIELEMKVLSELGLSCDVQEHMARVMGLTAEGWYAHLTREYARVHGRELPEDFVSEYERRYHAVMEGERLTEVAGAKPAVARLSCRKAVASSSGLQALEAKLRQTGIWEHFAPHVYSAELVRHGKPEPDLFLYTADALQVAPRDCLVIEDSVNGVIAARAAGMRVWGFLGGGHMKDNTGERLLRAGAERSLKDWDEAFRALDAIDR